MITALDTNILLDILIPDEIHFQRSKELLDEYFGRGQLVVCEMVYAEIAAQFPSEDELRDFFCDTGINLSCVNEKSLGMAGERWKRYAANRPEKLQCPLCGRKTGVTCSHCGQVIKTRQHILSDFIIAAHATLHADVLLSRDRGFYKTYFPELQVIR